MIEGKITRISGPIIYAEGLDGCGLYDVVDVGEKKLIGEIIRQCAQTVILACHIHCVGAVSDCRTELGGITRGT